MKSIGDITRQSVVRVIGKIQDTRARDFECEIKAMKLISWQKLFIHYLLILLVGLKVILTTG